jgi:DNA repair protein RadC
VRNIKHFWGIGIPSMSTPTTVVRGFGYRVGMAAAVLFVYNHPSGDPTLSREHIENTAAFANSGLGDASA